MHDPKVVRRLEHIIIKTFDVIQKGGIPRKSWKQLWADCRKFPSWIQSDTTTETDMYQRDELRLLSDYGNLMKSLRDFLVIALVVTGWFFLVVGILSLTSRR